ncbi:MAG: YfbK domain-containing protein [Acidimicrobiia bacterium]
MSTSTDPLSTFALDVDTGSYSLARNQLNNGRRPTLDQVRVEEFVNSFDYSYADPRGEALGIAVDGAPSPFDSDNWLLRVGVQGERVRDDERPPAHLTFVVDTSGSMDLSNRLPLVRSSLQLLVEELEDEDTVAIVTYNDQGEVLLEPTSVADRGEILDAISGLRPGGSTNLEAGLRVGYELAREVNVPGDISRVVVASDGLANAGVTNVEQLSRQIREDADNGIRLMTVGYGLEGFNDATMEQLADQSDGVYAYVDTLDEAEEIFEENLTANLYTIAVDAKIQLEFEPGVVHEYRLIGFENRGVLDRDFRNDNVDAGEIGAGHQVTALYELRLVTGVDLGAGSARLGEVNLRWQDPGDGGIVEIAQTIRVNDLSQSWSLTSDEFKLAGTVGVFAELLRESPHAVNVGWDLVENEAEFLRDTFDTDEVTELYELVRLARKA